MSSFNVRALEDALINVLQFATHNGCSSFFRANRSYDAEGFGHCSFDQAGRHCNFLMIALGHNFRIINVLWNCVYARAITSVPRRDCVC